MATYKLIQDIEAEDKILGPLTLRQFIFALIAIFMGYICFILVVKHFAFLLVLFLPPALFFGFFALPFGRDQPTEVWALAKLRFWFKPRRRLWNQSGVKELVTITVPKKVERVLTNGLGRVEVESRLKVLADTLDSRGWAVKHVVDGNTYRPAANTIVNADSDRLIDISSLPREVPSDDSTVSDDILDTSNSPIARQFETMIDQSSRSHRQELMDQLNDIRGQQTAKQQAAASADNWFMSKSQTAKSDDASRASSDDSRLSAGLAARTGARQVSFGNLRTIQPPAAVPAPATSPAGPAAGGGQTAMASAPAAMTTPSDPAILSLARNDDLNVATLAREAKKNKGDGSQSSDEVVISLH